MSQRQAKQQAAAQAETTAPPQPAAPPPQANSPAARSALGDDVDPIERLQQLGDMKANGLLTDEEFAAAKAKLLGT